MGVRGDLFELVDAAPAGIRSLEDRLRQWQHHERLQAARTELLGPGARTVTITLGSGARATTSNSLSHVWAVLPERWRIDTDDHIDASDGRKRWIGTGEHLVEYVSEAPDLRSTMVGRLLWPRATLGTFVFAEPVEDSMAGRPCLRVDAHADRPGRAHRQHALVEWGGTDHTFWFDRETGIVLRHVSVVDGRPAAVSEFTRITFDGPVDGARFELTGSPAAVIPDAEHLARIAEQQGVDLSSVDRTDARAVQSAMAAHRSPPQRGSEEWQAFARAAHVPLGPPPADEAAARAAVTSAVEHRREVADDGTTLVNVQRGEGLAPPMEETSRRVPGGQNRPEALAIVVDDVLFVRPDEAVVWFTVTVDGEPVPAATSMGARVVLVDGRWLVSHATVVGLIRIGNPTWRPSAPPPPPT